MKNPIKKMILHTVNEDLTMMKSVTTITFWGVTIFKKKSQRKVSITLF